MDKCIITAALSGVAASKDQCPAIPYTPEEYASEARKAYEAGASVVHLHARYPDGTPSYRVEEYRQITQAILSEAPDLIINYSTGAVHIAKEERVSHIVELKPDLGALNMGSMNYAKYSSKRKEMVFDLVFENRFETIIYFLEKLKSAGVKPECECFDTGHIHNTAPLIDMGLLQPPIQFSLILGVLGGAPADARTLAHMASLVPQPATGGFGGVAAPRGTDPGAPEAANPLKSTWQVIGVSRDQWMMVEAALQLGGNLRVGLEDNFYLPDGEMAESNGNLVAAAAKLVSDSGREVASPSEARDLLNLQGA